MYVYLFSTRIHGVIICTMCTQKLGKIANIWQMANMSFLKKIRQFLAVIFYLIFYLNLR